MKIVAFLQNMWVLPHHVADIEKHPPTSDMREALIRKLLFHKSPSGRRLKAIFGQDLCNSIVWQEASPIIACSPKPYYPPDPVHIRNVINKHHPEIVISFTKRGEDIIKMTCSTHFSIPHFIPAVHPAARHYSAQEILQDARNTIRTLQAQL